MTPSQSPPILGVLHATMDDNTLIATGIVSGTAAAIVQSGAYDRLIDTIRDGVALPLATIHIDSIVSPYVESGWTKFVAGFRHAAISLVHMWTPHWSSLPLHLFPHFWVSDLITNSPNGRQMVQTSALDVPADLIYRTRRQMLWALMAGSLAAVVAPFLAQRRGVEAPACEPLPDPFSAGFSSGFGAGIGMVCDLTDKVPGPLAPKVIITEEPWSVTIGRPDLQP
jgi:hypothetical protein